ncbi:MAG: hypothetical protein KF729_12705 [Sandaracinaceae bacterium]|nr:hypothetical protein [Sandaracinaceae bacterium]
MGDWDDTAAVRAAVAAGRVKQLASDFRHDRHGEVLLALSSEEREPILAASEPMRNKAGLLARVLASGGRPVEAFTIYEAIGARLGAEPLGEVIRLVRHLPSTGSVIDPQRVRVLLESALLRVREWTAMTAHVAAVATRIGAHELALEVVREGMRGGLDPTALATDPALAPLRADPRWHEITTTLFPPREEGREIDVTPLSRRWNEAGRAHFAAQHEGLVGIYERGVEVELAPDPREAELGDAVVAAVLALRDEPGAARAAFDHACMPFVHRFPPGAGLPIGHVTILGPDDLVVRAGPAYLPARVLRLRGGGAELVPGVVAVAANRAHTRLALARPNVGIEVLASLEGPVEGMFPWPDWRALLPLGALRDDRADEPLRLELVRLSGDGQRVLVVGYRQGVFLGSRRPGEPAWRYLGGAGQDMLHGDLSDDGALVVSGSQGSLHELRAIGADGAIVERASVGPRSEYPHFACFTDDGRGVALNACHFYAGATGYFDTIAGAGARSEHYEESPHLRVIDDGLRVYAGAWLAPDVAGWLGAERGAFALVGAGVLRVVTPDARLLAAQVLGSSGSSADHHPALGLLAVGTYAGQVHVLDAREGAEIGTQDGWTRGGATAGLREVRRWLLWPELAGGPVAW